MKATLVRITQAGVLLLAVVAMQACAVQRLASLPPSAAAERLGPGDPIVVELKNGKRYRAVVASVTDTALVTRVRSYAWEDIAHVEVQEVNAVSTVAGYSLLAAIIAGVAYVVVSDTFED